MQHHPLPPMSIVIVQIIIQQWDKSQREPHHVEARTKLPNTRVLGRDTSFYICDQHCIIDKQGDDVLGNRLSYKYSDDNLLQIDRFNIDLSTTMIAYTGQENSVRPAQILASIDNNFIQCQYQWRYRVFEGGFYYWLYELVTINAISVDTLQETIFVQNKPKQVFDNLA